MKSCRISLVLLCFFFAVIVPGLSADESTSLSNAAIVLPFKVETKVAAEKKPYLGFAIGNLLENVLAVHDGLEECWLNWHLPDIFPTKEDLQKWLDSDEEIPAKAKQLRVRFIVTGKIRRQGKELVAAITLLDQSDDKRFDTELIVDLPMLQNFRAGFLDLLAKSVIEPSPMQRPKMLWEEDLAQDDLVLMGRGIHDFLVASHYGGKKAQFSAELFQKALKQSPRSYLLLDNLGWVRFEQKKYSLAIGRFQNALALNSSGADAIDGMVSAAAAEGDEALAERWTYRKAQIQNKGAKLLLAAFWNRRGVSAYELKDYPTAIKNYRKALELEPEDILYLTNLAMALSVAGNLPEAKELLEKGLETSPAPESRKEIERLLAAIWYQQGNASFAQNDNEKAIDCLRESVRLNPEQFTYVEHLALAYFRAGKFEEMRCLLADAITRFPAAEDHQTLSRLLSTAWAKKAEAANQNKDYNTAIEAYEKAVSLDREAIGYAIALAELYPVAGKFEKGVGYVENLLKQFHAAKDQQSLWQSLWYVHFRWGVALKDANSFEASIPHLRTAVTISVTHARNFAGVSLDELGWVYRQLGRYKEATAIYNQAIDICRLLKDVNQEVVTLILLGTFRVDLGDYEKAIRYHQRALQLCEANKNADWSSKSASSACGHLGADYFARKNYAKAKEFYEHALKLAEKQKDEEDIKLDRLGIAFVLVKLGNIEEAIDELNKALVLVRQEKDRDTEGQILNTLGVAYALGKDKDYAKAIESLTNALAIEQEQNDVTRQATTLSNLMGVWNLRGKRRLAIFFGKMAINTMQSTRRNVRKLERRLQETYLHSVQDRYRELADLLVSEGRIPEGEQVLRLLKEEEYQDFVRSETVNSASGGVPLTAVDRDWQQRFNAIQNQIATIGKDYAALVSKESRNDEENRRLERLENELALANKALDQLYNDISAEVNPKLVRDLKDSGQTLMQNLPKIDTDAVVLETIVLEDKYRVILTTPEVQIPGEYTIGRQSLRKKVFALRQAIRDQAPETEIIPLAKELYEILLGPVAENIEACNAKTLVWSLDDVLRYIPMAALYDGKQYIVQRYRNVVITEGSLVNLKDKPSPEWKALGLGVSKAHQGFVELPNVPAELRAIIHDPTGDKSGGVLPGKIMLDDNFTERNFKDALLRRQYPVVHIASHFTFNADGNSDDSFLLLGDGKLTMAQIDAIPNLFSGVELLTLSACDTATGANADTKIEKQGVEVESLGVLAQQKGATAVLASLWQVADESTSRLMQEFYRVREAQHGITKAEALQRAQIDLLLNSNREYAHPFYWAPFILIGNWQ